MYTGNLRKNIHKIGYLVHLHLGEVPTCWTSVSWAYLNLKQAYQTIHHTSDILFYQKMLMSFCLMVGQGVGRLAWFKLDDVQHCGDGFLGELLQNIVKTKAFIVNVAIAEDRLHLKKHSTGFVGKKGGISTLFTNCCAAGCCCAFAQAVSYLPRSQDLCFRHSSYKYRHCFRHSYECRHCFRH